MARLAAAHPCGTGPAGEAGWLDGWMAGWQPLTLLAAACMAGCLPAGDKENGGDKGKAPAAAEGGEGDDDGDCKHG